MLVSSVTPITTITLIGVMNLPNEIDNLENLEELEDKEFEYEGYIVPWVENLGKAIINALEDRRWICGHIIISAVYRRPLLGFK